MRNEQQMLELILSTARQDERIRAVCLEGSRTNPKAPRDIFQDYDVVYVVGETASFQQDKGWIDRFGKRLYMQYPEDHPVYPSDREHCYGWLIQFADGNRLSPCFYRRLGAGTRCKGQPVHRFAGQGRAVCRPWACR